MPRGNFVVVALMVAGAVALGVFVGALEPPASQAVAADLSLNLASPPPATNAVATPSFADLVDRDAPSCVAIVSSKQITAREQQQDEMGDNPFFRFFRRGEPFGNPDATPQSPKKQSRKWGGSGFFITPDGYILTNKHVVEDAESVVVLTSDMRESDDGLPAKVVGEDPFMDLALLKVAGSNFPALPLGDSDKLRVGEWVIAIGNPLVFRNTVTLGVVSGKGRRLDNSESAIEDYIQTDAAINFGNSGGPLLNARGEVVGINSNIVRDDGSGASGYIQGIGFAVPISPVKRVLGQLAATGTVKRAMIGVRVERVSNETAEYMGLPRARGAYVSAVDPGLPADKAGIKKDDIILSVDGRPISGSEELVNAISAHRPGETVKLTIWRERKELEVSVTLTERPAVQQTAEAPQEAPEDNQEATALGFSVAPLPRTLRDHLREVNSNVKGVLITDVDQTSSAYNKGVSEGMILVDVNGQPTQTVEAYRRLSNTVKAGEVVRLRLVNPRGGDEVTIFFRAPAHK